MLFRSPDLHPIILQAGPDFFKGALAVLDEPWEDGKALLKGIKNRTGAKGKGLFMPLRAVLTGRTDGPEMARLLGLLSRESLRSRLEKGVELSRG